MRHASIALAMAAVLLSSSVQGATPSRKARIARPPAPPPTLDVPAGTRLLVIAPHPDDEVLGAGGLMQRVRSTGGAVRIVYLTDGEGYPEGVRDEDHVATPTAKNYLGYGKQRRREARAALVRLGPGRRVPDVSRVSRRRAVPVDAAPTGRAARRLSIAVHAPDQSAKAELLVPGHAVPRRGSLAGARARHRRFQADDDRGAASRKISTPITAPPGSFSPTRLTDVRRVHPSSGPTSSTTSSTSTRGRSRTMGRGSIRRRGCAAAPPAGCGSR
jgi:hypothetical protein